MRPALMLLGLIALEASAQAPLPGALPDPLRQTENALQDERYFGTGRSGTAGPGAEIVIECGGPESGTLPESDAEFELRDVAFTESEFLSAAELERIAADYRGRPVRFADLNAMIGRINATYAERGIVSARAIVPPQTVEDGVL